jgi:hypothetical protein
MKSTKQLDKHRALKRASVNRFLNQLNRDNCFYDDEDRKVFYMDSRDYFRTDLRPSLSMTDIQDGEVNGITYKIRREEKTNAWFFTCDKMLVLHIKPDFYDDFVFCQTMLDHYTFEVYKSSTHYIAFCTSNMCDEVNMAKFMLDNECDLRYAVCASEMGSFILLNNSFIRSAFFKDYKLTYVQHIGTKSNRSELEQVAKTAVSFVNASSHLPIHYMYL